MNHEYRLGYFNWLEIKNVIVHPFLWDFPPFYNLWSYSHIYDFSLTKIIQMNFDFCMILIFPLSNLKTKKKIDVIHPHQNLHRCASKFRGVLFTRRPPARVFTTSCTRTQVPVMWERNRTTIKSLLRYCALSGTNQWKALLNSWQTLWIVK